MQELKLIRDERHFLEVVDDIEQRGINSIHVFLKYEWNDIQLNEDENEVSVDGEVHDHEAINNIIGGNTDGEEAGYDEDDEYFDEDYMPPEDSDFEEIDEDEIDFNNLYEDVFQSIHMHEEIGFRKKHMHSTVGESSSQATADGLTSLFDNELSFLEHRFCLRHLWCNFRKQWGSKIFKDYLWNAARAYIENNFKFWMEKLKELEGGGKEAYEWLMRISLPLWTRHMMSLRIRCELLLNNLAKSFNALTLEAKDKPIITLMESIWRLLMLRFVKKKKIIKEHKQKLCTRIINKLEKVKKDSTACTVIPGGHGQQFEVTHSYGSKAVCDMREMSCTCKRWDYTRIPCLHACASIMYANMDPEDFVHRCYTMASFELCYAQGIDPVLKKED
ncbi:hypothetical protein Tsubulata_019775 [Turnera subulata]|uniref:SWIM-type domain-containing protein n=1 Tax=Turnera subulata TaxID=218843 RepID=A0A9Q0FU34_9ROSI|nr:hypothetical protein Tsubulata_019775 [Turnera subulata]